MDTQRFSRIANGLKSASISSVTQTADALRREGKEVLVFSIGRPDFDTPEHIKAAANDALAKGFVHYTHNRGILPMREAVAAYLKRQNGLDYDPKTEIMITAGAQEALMLCTHALLDPGDEVLVPEPFYANYNGFAMEAGVNIKPISSTIANDFALPPMEEFERLITTRTKAILICNPNNPTGYVYSEQEYEQLKNIVLKHDLYLMADEVYREFCYDGTKCISVMNLKGVEQNVVMIDSVSKRYSMCGVRLGTLVSRNRRIIDAALKMGQARLCPPYLAQVAAEAALGAPRSYFEEVHDEYAARRNCIIEALNKIEGVEWVLDPVTMQSLVGALVGLPNGVLAMSHAVEGLVETSSNLASVKFGAEGIVVTTSQRSSVESAKRYAAQTVEAVLRLSGAEVAHSDGYPGWSPDPDSYLLHVTEQCYERLFAVKPKVRAIHAGLECGLFLEKYPELDMVSFGPTLRGVHSPDERLEIATVQKFWDLLCAVVGSL